MKLTYTYSELSDWPEAELIESYDKLAENVQVPELILMELHHRRQMKITRTMRNLSWWIAGMATISALAVLLSAIRVNAQSVAEMREMEPEECLNACVEKAVAEDSCEIPDCMTQCMSLCGIEEPVELSESDSAWAALSALTPGAGEPRYSYLSATVVSSGLFTSRLKIGTWSINDSPHFNPPKGPGGKDIEFKSATHLISYFGNRGWEYLESSSLSGDTFESCGSGLGK